jgi:hypothetical protein
MLIGVAFERNYALCAKCCQGLSLGSFHITVEEPAGVRYILIGTYSEGSDSEGRRNDVGGICQNSQNELWVPSGEKRTSGYRVPHEHNGFVIYLRCGVELTIETCRQLGVNYFQRPGLTFEVIFRHVLSVNKGRGFFTAPEYLQNSPVGEVQGVGLGRKLVDKQVNQALA